MVGLVVLKLWQEVVSHPCMLLALVLVAKWDTVSGRDKLLTGNGRYIYYFMYQKQSKECCFKQEQVVFPCHTFVTPRSRVN